MHLLTTCLLPQLPSVLSLLFLDQLSRLCNFPTISWHHLLLTGGTWWWKSSQLWCCCNRSYQYPILMLFSHSTQAAKNWSVNCSQPSQIHSYNSNLSINVNSFCISSTFFIYSIVDISMSSSGFNSGAERVAWTRKDKNIRKGCNTPILCSMIVTFFLHPRKFLPSCISLSICLEPETYEAP